MHVGGCVAVSTRSRRRAEEKARELGVEMQFRREKLRRRVEVFRSGFRTRRGFEGLHGGGGQTAGGRVVAGLMHGCGGSAADWRGLLRAGPGRKAWLLVLVLSVDEL
jgi:hypothetical protein